MFTGRNTPGLTSPISYDFDSPDNIPVDKTNHELHNLSEKNDEPNSTDDDELGKRNSIHKFSNFK